MLFSKQKQDWIFVMKWGCDFVFALEKRHAYEKNTCAKVEFNMDFGHFSCRIRDA